MPLGGCRGLPPAVSLSDVLNPPLALSSALAVPQSAQDADNWEVQLGKGALQQVVAGRCRLLPLRK